MVEKRYKWNEGAKLEEHSHRKHKILREYVFKYLIIRCQLPQQTRFRLAIVSIAALLAFLKKADASGLRQQLHAPNSHDLQKLEETMSQQSWLGAAERIVFDSFQSCAPFVSPFSINNPDGWRYWLIHFSNAYRARQVYNAVLHQNASSQAHFGRAGLNMLSYDPTTEGKLYLFEDIDRESARNQLFDDIPRLASTAGDGIVISELCQSIYKATPAHADDVNTAIIGHPDMEVLTPTGGKRREASTISMNDVLRLKTQKSFFLMFFDSKSSNRK